MQLSNETIKKSLAHYIAKITILVVLGCLCSVVRVFSMEQEIWKDVVGYEGLYKVSNYSKVKSLDKYVKYCNGKTRFYSSCILRPGNSHGYYTVSLTKKKIKKSHHIQILCLEAFICIRPFGMFGLHNDGNPSNNYIENLRWGTRSDNSKDAIKHGTFNFGKGENHQLSKLKEKQVIEIKKHLLEAKLNQREIAELFNIKSKQISKIKTGVRWGHVKIS